MWESKWAMNYQKAQGQRVAGIRKQKLSNGFRRTMKAVEAR